MSRGLSLLAWLDSPARVAPYLEEIAQTPVAADAARVYDEALNKRRAGFVRARSPRLLDIGASHWFHLTRVYNTISPSLRGSFRMVEIAPLLTNWVDVDVETVERYMEIFRDGDQRKILSVCLPSERPVPRLESIGNQVTLRVAERPVHVSMSMTVTISTCVTVSVMSGRFILVDGTHRALALSRLGHSYVPAVIKEELAWGGVRALAKRSFGPPTLALEDPPQVGYYLNEVSIPIDLKNVDNLVHVTLGIG